jgi:hypothetical protein
MMTQRIAGTWLVSPASGDRDAPDERLNNQFWSSADLSGPPGHDSPEGLHDFVADFG